MAVTGAVLCGGVVLAQQAAQAGHESPFYPSFYPQEIRIETLDPAAAAAGWSKPRVHAYIGGAPFAGSPPAANAVAVSSLRSYVVLTFDAVYGPYAAGSAAARSRCVAAEEILRVLAQNPAGYVFHPYPVTPYHADYLEHADLAARAKSTYAARRTRAAVDPGLKIRAKGPLAEKLVPATLKAGSGEWDATLEEVGVDKLVDASVPGFGSGVSPWMKQGWFQAHRLYADHFVGGVAGLWAEHAYRRLVAGEYDSATERINLERALTTMLVAGCERVVVGYTTRDEYFDAEYSNGVENIAFDSQAGLHSSIFLRTVKLKDFPWNGWLRLGVATAPTAAWNPVGGFDDDFGRWLWMAVADPALLPEPYGGSWIANRASIASTSAGVVAVPEAAQKPEAGTGLLRAVGPGKTARQRLRYSVVTSAFHDGTATGVADIVYPYIFAFRWSIEQPAEGNAFDPAIARSTVRLRDWLAGFNVVGIETQTKDYGGDLKFSYRVPVVDVYLEHRAADPWIAGAVAPPWSTLPWEVIVLMEEAVTRGIAAFSRDEAERRGIPWLDLVRDRRTGERLAKLVDEFRQEGYRPAALESLVSVAEARERWAALSAFHARYGHFLVTNGPYRLESWTAESVVLEVFRDSSYPLGVGAFDRYAIPVRAYASRIEDRGDRIEIVADIEQVSKAQRGYEIQRVALAPVAAQVDEDQRPICRYVVVGPSQRVLRAGTAAFGKSGRFVIDLKRLGPPGLYTVAAAIFIGDNQVNPEVTLVEHRAGRTVPPRVGMPRRSGIARATP